MFVGCDGGGDWWGRGESYGVGGGGLGVGVGVAWLFVFLYVVVVGGEGVWGDGGWRKEEGQIDGQERCAWIRVDRIWLCARTGERVDHAVGSLGGVVVVPAYVCTYVRVNNKSRSSVPIHIYTPHITHRSVRMPISFPSSSRAR